MEEFNLIDIWRTRNPDVRRYTWRNPTIPARLDFWIAPNSYVYRTIKCNIETGVYSDHSIMSLLIKTDKAKSQHSTGTWKLNTSLLTDKEYINRINAVIENVRINTKMN
jgi:hypothetical protein